MKPSISIIILFLFLFIFKSSIVSIIEKDLLNVTNKELCEDNKEEESKNSVFITFNQPKFNLIQPKFSTQNFILKNTLIFPFYYKKVTTPPPKQDPFT